MSLPSTMLPSIQFPGLLCFGADFLSLMVPFLESFLDATLMVCSAPQGIRYVV
jgi:hypothetical protein